MPKKGTKVYKASSKKKRITKKQTIGVSAIADRALLENAWNRILSSGDLQYKNYVRLEMQAFGTSYNSLLDLIFNQLKAENYEPQPIYKVNIPKGKFANRTLRLLSIPDYIVYSAITTLIIEAAYEQQQDVFNKVLFSNVPLSHRSGRPTRFFRKWVRQYAQYNKYSKQYVNKGYNYLAEIDIASFYDFIDHDLLFEFIKKYFKDSYALELLERMLKYWSATEDGYQFSHGLPQGPDASRYLADLFLYSLDKHMLSNTERYKYLRYVDDIRIFCKTKRNANAEVIHIEEEIKKLGLVPNTSKVHVVDARKDLDWLKEESSEAQALDAGSMGQKRVPRSIKKVRHLLSKPTFLKNCVSKSITANNSYLTRRSLPKLLPDKEVVKKIIEVYEERPDLYTLFYQYLRECDGMKEVERFCWRQLKKDPISDFECANLMGIAISIKQNALTKNQIEIMKQFIDKYSLPLSAATAAGILFKAKIIKPLRNITAKLPIDAPHIVPWLVPMINLRRSKKVMPRSVKAATKKLLESDDPRTSFIVSYLVASRYKTNVISSLPKPKSQYSRQLLVTMGQININPLVDEIAPLLSRLFGVKIPGGFDFRKKFALINTDLYNRALRHLQLASWYFDTYPTYFINHIHNFNHVLLYFALHNGNFIANPPLQWKHIFGQIAPNQNTAFASAFPAVSSVFRECSKARNTNLSSHPYDDKYSRFTKLVSYGERDELKSKLKVAYREFMVKV